MQFVSRITLLALGLFPLGFAQFVSTSTVTTTTTTTSIGSTSIGSSSTSTTSSYIASVTPAPTPSTTDTADELILTTIFTQPSGCDTGITEIPPWYGAMYQNVINPVPTLTLTSCYPSQFYYSAVATVVLPPFSQLICPKDWETNSVNESYIICCPKDYGLYAPNWYDPVRPGLYASCTSSIQAGVQVDITSYDSTALAGVITTTAGENQTLVLATAYEGHAATVTASGTATGSSTVASSTSTTTSSVASPRLYFSQALCLLQMLLLLVLL